MTLDIFIGVFIFLLVLSGMKKGFIRQFFNLLAFVGAVSIIIFGDSLVNTIVPSDNFFTLLIFKIIASIIFYAITLFIGKKMKDVFFVDNIKEKLDHLLGGLISGIKGTLIVAVLISMLSTIPNWILIKQQFMTYAFDNSKFFPIIYKYNPLTFISVYRFFNLINKDSNILNYIEDESLRALFDNEELKQAAAENNLLAFVNNPAIKEIISNSELIKTIEKIAFVNDTDESNFSTE